MAFFMTHFHISNQCDSGLIFWYDNKEACTRFSVLFDFF